MPERVVIGSEVDDERKIDLLEQGSTTVLPVTLVNGDGDALAAPSGLVSENFNAISVSVTATEDIYSYKTGGVSGTTVATTTVTYTDSTKTQLLTVVKT